MKNAIAQYADLFEAAADVIRKRHRHPGQPVPGVWVIDSEHTPERLIGAVAASALAQACAGANMSIDDALKTYAETSHVISLTAQGGPDVIAAKHLRDAAVVLRQRSLRLV